MAALTITAANVSLVDGTPYANQPVGEAAAAGSVVYRNDSGVWLKAQCDGTATEAGANDVGILLSTADGTGARVSVAGPGCTVGLGTGTAGVVYAIGRVAGQIVPTADLLATDKVTVIGIGIGTSRLQLTRLYNAGAVL